MGFQQKPLIGIDIGGVSRSVVASIDMAVPKRKQSNSRTGHRRSHDALTPKQLSSCPKCGKSVPTHIVCPNCGYYMGRTVVQVEEAKS